MSNNDLNAINEIKTLSLDMIKEAKSGSPGNCLSLAPIIYTLYAKHMNINPDNQEWINRDRLVLSCGHAAPILYATLHMCGFKITKENLKEYKSISGFTPAYPELSTNGIDISIGTPGMGISNAVGIALGERYLENTLKQEDEKQSLINFNTYVICNDADLMKGVSYEATSFASAQKLDKLIILCDRTNIISDGKVDNTFTENLIERFQSLDFFVKEVKDASKIKEIDKAINAAKKSNKPSIIIFNTILGKDSINENTNIVYDKPLSDDDIFAIKKKLNITTAPFEVRKDSLIHVRKLIDKRVEAQYKKNMEYLNKAKSSGNDKLINILRLLINKDLTIPFESLSYKINDTYNENLLLTNHKILNLVANKSAFFLGGCADAASNTKAYIDNTTILTKEHPLGRNINFGLREEAMAGIINGISLLGLKTYCSTKLINLDNLKPSIRMSAIMNLDVTYIFTHDSINSSLDSAHLTPVEHISNLRSIPNLINFRPSDITEILGVWEYIAKNKKTTSIILSDCQVSKLRETNSKLVSKGAYIVKKEQDKLDGIIIATGKELGDALKIAYELKQENIDIRVISMVSLELFLKEEKNYQEEIIPKNVKTIVIEPSSILGWGIFVTDKKYIIGLDDFSFSGQKDEVINKVNFDYESLKIKVAKLILNN